MPHATENAIQIVPLSIELRKDSQLGAEVILPDHIEHLEPSKLTTADLENLRQALFENGVLVIRNQSGLDPAVLPQLAKVFDPTAKDIHSGGEKLPRAPQVTVIGQGIIEGHEGLPTLNLKHVDHTDFHEEPLSAAEIEQGYTRPYRWHMDAPLYENLPGFVTSLLCHQIPDLPDQKLKFPDGSEMQIDAGATAFFSGARSFELLSPEQKIFAMNTTVHYAPRAYEWMKECKATADGLTISKTGREKSIDELPPFDPAKVQSFPMAWLNPHTNKPHLQILGCCVHSLSTHNPITNTTTHTSDLQQVREICHAMQGKVYKAENVYAHRWQEGDLVLFHNRGVMHSITGQLGRWQGKKRVLWQCSMASGSWPEAYRV
ncbi:alpha-ketoglutarate dependent xanthine dioxygenase [Teratosphaeria nubilosa]|uniref:Alpha-ketoglutarate dependent xanthine dioxygenase n=1 Tax=Teratosphaeria nubilosa TaxID=161662 RepID=A0A6G1LD62_9PEZI|nr:alpha-ketoglutarate dependent xanthine dioxygenase [Teratosphaeria nubilosa]